MQYVFDTTQGKRYTFPTHVNDLIIDRSQATTSEVFIVVLQPGEAPPPHTHDDAEQVFYVLEGTGTLRIGPDQEAHPVKAGDAVRVPPSTLHAVEATGGLMRYLAVDCFTSNRITDQATWDEHIRVLCREQGWDYDTVIK